MKFSGKTYFDPTDNLEPSPWSFMDEGEGEGGHLKLKKMTQKVLGLKLLKMVRNGKKWKKKCYDLLSPFMSMHDHDGLDSKLSVGSK